MAGLIPGQLVIVTILIVFTFLVTLVKVFKVGSRPPGLPPGPPTIPILGNLHLVGANENINQVLHVVDHQADAEREGIPSAAEVGRRIWV